MTTAAAVEAPSWSGEVGGVKDGDTIVVLHDGRGETIRLYGIDAPEKGQDFGNRAKQTLSELVFRKVVEIKNMDTDRYGRMVAVVTIGMKTANEAMIEAGMAWVFEKYCHKAFCNGWRGLQEKAKAKRIGLWSHPKPIPPWEWRKSRKAEHRYLVELENMTDNWLVRLTLQPNSVS